ncbi:MAG: prepilin-type N-terminal cleavage/methylation domain-containing protein, partial [Anaerovoracaceae bacterium]
MRKWNRNATGGFHGRRGRGAGFSLIEVIVSMLIMSLVVVPLVNNFAVVARTNVKAREIKAATDFAQQIMESLQAYGADSVNDQFWSQQSYTVGTNTENYAFTPFYIAELGEDYAAVDTPGKTDGVKAMSIPGAGGEVFSSPADVLYDMSSLSESHYYQIEGGKADTGKLYDVRITYTPLSRNLYNGNVFPDAGDLQSGKTIVINTAEGFVNYDTDEDGEYLFEYGEEETSKGEGGRQEIRYKSSVETEYDQFAADIFFSRFEIYHEYVADYANNLLSENYIFSEDSSPIISEADLIRQTDTSTTYDHDASLEAIKQKKKDAITNQLARKLDLIFTRPSGAENLEISAELNYYVDQLLLGNKDAVDTYINDKLQIYNKDWAGDSVEIKSIIDKIKAASDQKYQEIIGKYIKDGKAGLDPFSVYSTIAPSDLSSIYLMYVPMDASAKKADEINVDVTRVEGYDDQTPDIDLFVVPQLGLKSASSLSGYSYYGAHPVDYVLPKVSGTKFPGDARSWADMLNVKYLTQSAKNGLKADSLLSGTSEAAVSAYLDLTESDITGNNTQNDEKNSEKRKTIVKAQGAAVNQLYTIRIEVYRHHSGDSY